MLLRYTSRQHRIRTPSGRNVKSSEDVTIRKGGQTTAASKAGAARCHHASCRRRALLDACALTVSWRSPRYPRRSRSRRRGEEQIRDRVPRRHRAGRPRPRGRCRPSAPTCPTVSLVLDQPMPPRRRLGAFSDLTQLLGVANSPCADFGESIRKLPRASAHPRQPVRGEPFARRGTQTEGLVLSVGRNSRGKR
jgi:hypothetical protein